MMTIMEVEVWKGRKKTMTEIDMNANKVERKQLVLNLEGNDLTVQNRVRIQEDIGREGIRKGTTDVSTILVALLGAEVGVHIERGVTGIDGQEVVVMIILSEVGVLIEKMGGPENHIVMSTEIRENTHHHLK